MKHDERIGFEERLLAALRDVVGEQHVPTRPPRGPRRLVLAGGLASAGVVAALASVFLLTGGATPAYAVSKNDDGTVTVEISSLRDAAGLEQKLRDAGIRAVVQYVPPGKACKQPWPETLGPPPAGDEHHMFKGGIEHTGDHTRFTISNDLPANLTLVIMTQTGPDDSPGREAVGIAFAHGDVGPCELVDAPEGIQPPGAPPPGAGVTVHHEGPNAERAPSAGK